MSKSTCPLNFDLEKPIERSVRPEKLSFGKNIGSSKDSYGLLNSGNMIRINDNDSDDDDDDDDDVNVALLR